MKKLLTLTFVLISSLAFSQKKQHQPARNATFIELGGIGKAMYSINYDRVLAYSDPFSLALKAGVMFPSVDSEDTFRKEYTFPVELSIRTLDDGFMEFGIGQVFTPDQAITSYEAPPYLRLGFRSQNEDGGVLFRLSLVSNLLHKEFKPRLAFAMGYAF